MKSARRAWLLLVLIACVAVAPMLMAPPRALAVGPAAPEVVAQGVAILDEAGNLVYGKNPHKRYAMASLTKTMTAVVALENSDIKKRVLVDVSWDEIPDSSIMGLSLMEEVTIEEMLYGLMLPSGNDAARAIARAISGDEYHFAEL
ncbi:MAG: D-alanyl-D-alanine carboxypeptidase family protein, partial [Chloroflexota bacterium]